MTRIESISLTQLTDDQWQKYCEASKEIRRVYYPELIRKHNTWQEFKKEYLERIEFNKQNFYNEQVFFENGIVAGWVDYYVDSNACYFGFNYMFDVIPGSLISLMLNSVYNIVCEKNLKSANYWSFDSRRIDVMKNINAEISEEFETYKLDRKDMSIEMYYSIIENAKLPGDFDLKLYNELPENLTDKFIEFENNLIEEINKLNPSELKIPLMKITDFSRQALYNKNIGVETLQYILLNEQGDIAANCSVLIDSKNKDTIRHMGGLTAVSKTHRGNGFGKFLKAKLYKLLLDENKDFKYILTDTMPWNSYMFRINNEFGFKPFKHGYTFKLSKEFLENYLNK